MANTYTQLYIQIVFSPWGRASLISPKHKEELQMYATGIIQNRKHKLLALNFMPDHVHIFIGYNPSQPLPDLVRDVKASTSKLINDRRWIFGKFEWQAGYGAFTYSRDEMDTVIRYINSQEEHHRKESFKEEFIGLMKRFGVEYDERYMFKWIE
jgi:REP element-mobilizing transposase RayT